MEPERNRALVFDPQLRGRHLGNRLVPSLGWVPVGSAAAVMMLRAVWTSSV